MLCFQFKEKIKKVKSEKETKLKPAINYLLNNHGIKAQAKLKQVRLVKGIVVWGLL